MSSSLDAPESSGMKSKIKSIPFLTWLVRLVKLPARFNELSSRFDRLAEEQQRSLKEAKDSVDEVKSQIAYMTRDLEMLHHTLKEKAGLLKPEMVKEIADREFSSETYMYFAFENKYRGAKEEILKNQTQYVQIIEDTQKKSNGKFLLDVGCGRGEFLKLLRDHKIAAKGIDITQSMIDACKEEGLDAVRNDLLSYLKSIEENSLLGITAFQVVEHLPVDYLLEFIKAARSRIAPGGVLILETVNPDSLSSLKNFYLDLTHQNPIPSLTLKFLCENFGYKNVSVRFASEVPSASKLAGSDPNIQKLNQLLFGPQDYAVIGWK